MSKPPKIDRKELRSPDEFVKQGTHFLEVFVGHQRTLAIGLAMVLVGFLGWYFYDWRTTSQNEAGWKEYGEVMKLADGERWERLKKMASQYSSVASGQFAATQLADHYFDESKKQAEKDPKVVPPSAALAVEWYSTALKYSKLSPSEKGVLLVNRGGAFEVAQKWDEAMADFSESVKIGFEGKPLALLGQARVYEIKNQLPKAIETYEKVSADFLNTEYGKLAKNYLRKLKSPLFTETKS